MPQKKELTPAEKAAETRRLNAEANAKRAAGRDAAKAAADAVTQDETGSHGGVVPAPPPNAPKTDDEPAREPAPPANPPAVGSSTPDDDPATIAAEASEQPPVVAVEDGGEGREHRGRPNPTEAPDSPAMPKTELPPAPPRNETGGVDAVPGQTEGTTQGQSQPGAQPSVQDQPEGQVQRETAIFRAPKNPNQKQYLPDGSTVKFAGGFYRTDDAQQIRMLRARIDRGGAPFHEDDPVAIYRCMYCAYTSASQANVKTHMRQRHPNQQQLA
jgi:hypothetical protein